MAAEVTCYDVIGELDATMSRLGEESSYLVLGGIVTSALRDPHTVIDSLCKVVYAGAQSSEPVIRPENGTKRDIDVLITYTIDKDEKAVIEETLTEAVDDQLEVSVFGVQEHHPHITIGQSIGLNLGSWTSKRTIDASGVMHYELFPLDQPVRSESYEPWYLYLPNGSGVNMLNPVGHALAYDMRSISGPRFKDIEKVEAMKHNVADQMDTRAATSEGAFKEWREFADAILDIKYGRLSPTNPILRPGTFLPELAFFGAKSDALGSLESDPRLIKFAQTPIGAKLLSRFVS